MDPLWIMYAANEKSSVLGYILSGVLGTILLIGPPRAVRTQEKAHKIAEQSEHTRGCVASPTNIVPGKARMLRMLMRPPLYWLKTYEARLRLLFLFLCFFSFVAASFAASTLIVSRFARQTSKHANPRFTR